MELKARIHERGGTYHDVVIRTKSDVSVAEVAEHIASYLAKSSGVDHTKSVDTKNLTVLTLEVKHSALSSSPVILHPSTLLGAVPSEGQTVTLALPDGCDIRVLRHRETDAQDALVTSTTPTTQMVTPSIRLRAQYRSERVGETTKLPEMIFEPPPKIDAPPWLPILLPLIAGVALFAFTRSPFALITVTLTPLMMLGNMLLRRINRKRHRARAIRDGQASVRKLSKSLTQIRDEELAQAQLNFPPLRHHLNPGNRRGSTLWRVRPDDSDFLLLRLGTGPMPSRGETPVVQNLEHAPPEIQTRIDELISVHATLQGHPVVTDLSSVRGIGVCGSPAEVTAVVRGLLLSLARTHSPRHLKIGAILGEGWVHQLSSIGWLPHTDQSLCAGDPSQAQQVMDALRKSEGPVVMVLSDDAPIRRAALIQLLEHSAHRSEASAPEITAIWTAQHLNDIPAVCNTIIECADARITLAKEGLMVEPVTFESLDHTEWEAEARELSAFRDSAHVKSSSAELPFEVSLPELIDEFSEVDPAQRWRLHSRDPKLACAIGRDELATFNIDLRAHGPHALIAGTTGAGKSEFVQSWVLSLASNYSPDRVTFLFVDYKGGSAFAHCTELPHSVGIVTDLTPHLVHRALVSLRAELEYREHLFVRAKVRDLGDLEAQGHPDAPPALVIVVDEFAALIEDAPEFIDGIVDIAQRGRSLGIHLILATQRPAGVVTNNLRANTNLRIALRVADEADSVDVIGVTTAAHFGPEYPGRAAIKVGQAPARVIQSAYSNGHSLNGQRDQTVVISPFKLDDVSTRERSDASLSVHHLQPSAHGASDQEILVASLAAAAHATGVHPPRPPWIEPLAAAYDLTKLHQRSDTRILIGVQDIPQQQTQKVVYFEPDTDAHFAVFGSSGSGKSTVLRTIAVAAGITPRGGPVHVYGIDYTAGGLRLLTDLPHIGAVIAGDDEERMRRLFLRLESELNRRGETYAAANADSISSYRESTGNLDEPRILLLIDGFQGFRNRWEQTYGVATPFLLLDRILSAGRALGIHVGVSAERGQVIPAAMQSHIQQRIVLRLTNEDDYAFVSAPKGILNPDSPPGRAIVDAYETQVAVINGSADMVAQARATRAISEAIVKTGRPAPPPIQKLPETVRAADLPDHVKGAPVLGLIQSSLEPLRFTDEGLFIVAGDSGSGVTNTVCALVEACLRVLGSRRTYLLADGLSALTTAIGWDGVAHNDAEVSQLVKVLRDDATKLKNSLIVIENAGIAANSSYAESLSALVSQTFAAGGFIVASANIREWMTNFGFLGALKAARRGILLEGEPHELESIFGVKGIGRNDERPAKGRAYVVSQGRAERVQILLSEAVENRRNRGQDWIV